MGSAVNAPPRTLNSPSTFVTSVSAKRMESALARPPAVSPASVAPARTRSRIVKSSLAMVRGGWPGVITSTAPSSIFASTTRRARAAAPGRAAARAGVDRPAGPGSNRTCGRRRTMRSISTRPRSSGQSRWSRTSAFVVKVQWPPARSEEAVRSSRARPRIRRKRKARASTCAPRADPMRASAACPRAGESNSRKRAAASRPARTRAATARTERGRRMRRAQ